MNASAYLPARQQAAPGARRGVLPRATPHGLKCTTRLPHKATGPDLRPALFRLL